MLRKISRGLKKLVPMELPLEPNESDCCNSGCNPCILDVYEDQLKKYNQRKNQKETLSLFRNCLLTTAYTIFNVTNIEKHCKDAFLFTFGYVRFLKEINSNHNDSLKVIYKPSQYFMLKAGPKNEEFQRPYTPLPMEDVGNLTFTVLIKLYELGQMSTYIRKLKTGSKTIWRGPYGNFLINFSYKNILLIAQGIGISPLYSIVCDIIKNEDCDTFLKLYFCCKSCETIYLRNQLYDLQKNWNFSYEIFLSNSENAVSKYNETIHSLKLEGSIVKYYLEDKIKDTQVLICGSENFMDYFKDIVLDCKVDEGNIVLF